MNMFYNATKEGFHVDFRPTEEYPTLIREACNAHRPEYTNALLEAGADVNVKDSSGRNVLFVAIDNQMPLSLIEKIISRTDEIDLRDIYGCTALRYICRLMISTRYPYMFNEIDIDAPYKIIKALLKAGADPSVISSWEEEAGSMIFNQYDADIANKIDKVIKSYQGLKEQLELSPDSTYEYEI